MGKYNRASTARKLSKLTANMEATEPKKLVQVGTFDKLPKPHLKEVVLPAARAGGKTTAVKEAMKPKEEQKVEAPKPEPTPTPGAEIKVDEIQLGKTPAEIAKMNVYQKLTLARSIVGSMQLKKSGANDDAGFNYFELADFVPMINKLADRIGIMPQFSMTNDLGTLKIVNTDKPKEVAEFFIPTADLIMADAEGKTAEGIQVLGGKTTYLRRYLYQIAFEISVKDTVDSRPKTPAKPIEELDPRDIQAIDEANDLENLGQICQNIRSRKGFKQNQALLKHYTAAKAKLSK